MKKDVKKKLLLLNGVINTLFPHTELANFEKVRTFAMCFS